MRFRSLRRLFAHDFAPQKSPESFITASCYISCANSEIIVFNYFNSNSIFKLEKKSSRYLVKEHLLNTDQNKRKEIH